ncbi:MAG: Uncharacterised protein [Alphaproteobacteria bacterium UBA4588]|nr:MAG: Uncharacterised protein [Alphaproteobacteria bacterium UBA4588]
MSRFQPEKIHEQLGGAFYDKVEAASFPRVVLRYRNQAAADNVGLGGLDDESWIAHFAHFRPLKGSFPQPLALRYHGHQFGSYNPEIGDGRGFLFAQMREAGTGRLLDLGTKGSGTTPYSRTADGKLTLKGAVREIMATEMLAALNVPTSQTFSVIETGEALMRHDEPSPTRSAVMVRLLHSHIRIGSFQRCAYLGDDKATEALARHVVTHYYPDCDPNQATDTLYLALLTALTTRIADMVGAWMVAGFVHGVMNTDNFNLTGETFDFGPWRFLPNCDPAFTAAYFDQKSRYAYGRQPEAALWALCRLADCFVHVTNQEVLQQALAMFYPQMEASLARRLVWRLGLEEVSATQADALTKQFYKAARSSRYGWDALFHDLYGGVLSSEDKQWHTHPDLSALHNMLKEFQPRQSEDICHALKSAELVSLEISEVEAVWDRIAEQDDWTALQTLLDRIRAHGEQLQHS